MPQFVLTDANWKKFLADCARLRRQGVPVPQALVNEMIRARAEYLNCNALVEPFAAAVQAARGQVSAANPDAGGGVTDAAIISLYTEALC